jgi:hypothetical protein
MSVELVLLSSYSLVLLGVAQALRALGRRSTSPWASRTLAGHLRATGQEPDHAGVDDGPHSEVPRLYAGMALVAIFAALALSAGGLFLQQDEVGLSVFMTLIVLSALSLSRVVRRPSGLATNPSEEGPSAP